MLTELDRLYEEMRSIVASATQPRDPFRDISVKVHIRRPDRDSWTYLGRGLVSQEQSRIGRWLHSPSRLQLTLIFALSRAVCRFPQDNDYVRRGRSQRDRNHASE